MSPHAHHVLDARGRLEAARERVTASRVAVFDILLSAPRALTHQEVDAAARTNGIEMDRVTLYRVLEWLVEHGHAHRVEGQDRVWRFNAGRVEIGEHAHFKCGRCGKVFCLESVRPVVAVGLPDGFALDRAELTLYGSCPDCTG